MAGASGRGGPPLTDQERRRGRREAAFRVIGELLAAPASEAPAGVAGETPPPSPSGAWAAPSFGGALLDRYGVKPDRAPDRARQRAVLLALGGALAVGAALAWRFLR
jgi:hypothetical protein